MALEAKRLEQLKQSEYQTMVNRVNKLQKENDKAQRNTMSIEQKVKKLMEIRKSHYDDTKRKLHYYDQRIQEKQLQKIKNMFERQKSTMQIKKKQDELLRSKQKIRDDHNNQKDKFNEEKQMNKNRDYLENYTRKMVIKAEKSHFLQLKNSENQLNQDNKKSEFLGKV